MSERAATEATTTTANSGTADGDVETLQRRIRELERQRRSLQAALTEHHQTRYRRSAIGFGVVGGLAVLAGLVLPGMRAVLLSIGAAGLFGAVMTLYLTPDSAIPASLGEAIYATSATNLGRIAGELGLQDVFVYVPTPTQESAVTLFVPEHGEFDCPAPAALRTAFVVDVDASERGLAVDPIGVGLLERFDRALDGPVADAPDRLAAQLAEAIVEQFELVRSATVVDDAGGDRIVFRISGSVYGPLGYFDHPVPSFLASGVARGLETPVRPEIKEITDAAGEYLIVLRLEE